MWRDELAERIKTVAPESFWDVALDVFQYQAANNLIYAQYLDLLHVDARQVRQRTDIPYLPISLFKTQDLRSGSWPPVRTFTSSGTTGSATSHHPLRADDWYTQHASRTFESLYGPLRGRAVLALLPAYLERTGSSLVFMAEDFIRQSEHPASGFYLNNLPSLAKQLSDLSSEGVPTLLLGVSFALLDLAEQFPQPLRETIVMETGGMKGRRREMTRDELHDTLRTAFGVPHIHSEYGMTELLSQAYAPHYGVFEPAPTLAVTPRDITDPLSAAPIGRSAVLNLTDLANLDTISFIASDDLGRVYDDGRFEVLGRLDYSDMRGCNLLVGDV
ncbi:MAG: acyl transferase [Lewinella sp.]